MTTEYMQGLTIRQIGLKDLDFSAGCTAAEGWTSETREEFEGFLAYDPNGCLIAEVDAKKIGLCIATNYGKSGFIGNVIVVKDMRGCGVGRRLVEHAIAYLQNRGVQNVLLDAVPAVVLLYEGFGFRKLCRSLRFTGNVPGRVAAGVRAMRVEDLELVNRIDRHAFGADRSFFLERRLSLYPELCKVLDSGEEISGFIMGRQRRNVIWVGPWIVQNGAGQPEGLLEGLAIEAATLSINLGVLESNSGAVTTIRSLGLIQRPDPPWRMVLGPSGHMGCSERVFAIGSTAKG